MLKHIDDIENKIVREKQHLFHSRVYEHNYNVNMRMYMPS